jgi:hypothetical protein
VTMTGGSLTIGGATLNLNSFLTTNSSGNKSYEIDGTSATINGNNLVAVAVGTVTITGFVSSTTGFYLGVSNKAIFAVVKGASITDTKEFVSLSTKVTVYPNPSDGLINIRVLNDKAFKGTVRISSSEGKIVFNQPYTFDLDSSEIQIQPFNFRSGLYFIQIPELAFSAKLIVK